VIAFAVRLVYWYGVLGVVIAAVGLLVLTRFLNRPENAALFGRRDDASSHQTATARFYARRVVPVVAIVLGLLCAAFGFAKLATGGGLAWLGAGLLGVVLVAAGLIVVGMHRRTTH
jgi:lipopolysaccharide export LptBFGC system permease protein LptF